jgi:hypothetical protein
MNGTLYSLLTFNASHSMACLVFALAVARVKFRGVESDEACVFLLDLWCLFLFSLGFHFGTYCLVLILNVSALVSLELVKLFHGISSLATKLLPLLRGVQGVHHGLKLKGLPSNVTPMRDLLMVLINIVLDHRYWLLNVGINDRLIQVLLKWHIWVATGRYI